MKSALRLEKLVFDKLLFEREGFSSEKDFEFNMESQISQNPSADIFKVTLILNGKKLMSIESPLVLLAIFLLWPIHPYQMKIKTI